MASNSNFKVASRWFAKIALVLVMVVNATLCAGFWIATFGFMVSQDSAVRLSDTFKVAGILIAIPIFLAWLFGGLIGARICREPYVSATESWIRGMFIAGGASVAMYFASEFDVMTHDYSKAVETSAARGHSLNVGIFSLIIPVLLLIGGQCGRSLLLHVKGDNKSLERTP